MTLQDPNVPEMPLELVDQIFRLVDKKTLISCAAVHSTWVPFARALFWGTAFLDFDRLPLRRCSPLKRVYGPDVSEFVDTMRRRPELAQDIRALVIRGMTRFPHPFISNLPEGERGFVNPTIELQDMLNVVQHLSNLRTLELFDVSMYGPHQSSARHTSPRTLIPLERLSFYQQPKGSSTTAFSVLHLLDIFDPDHLDCVIRRMPKQSDSESPKATSLQLRNQRITSIHMESMNPGLMFLLEAIHPAPFVQNLQKVDIRLTYPNEVSLFSSVLRTAGPSIRDLKIDVSRIHDARIARRTGLGTAGTSAISLT